MEQGCFVTQCPKAIDSLPPLEGLLPKESRESPVTKENPGYIL